LKGLSSKLPREFDEKDLAILICIEKGKRKPSLVTDITGIYTQKSGKKIVEKRFLKLLNRGLIFQKEKFGDYYLNEELEIVLEKVLRNQASVEDLISVLTGRGRTFQEDAKRLISKFKKWEEKLLVTENDVKFLWAKSRGIPLRDLISPGSTTHTHRMKKLGLIELRNNKLILTKRGEEFINSLYDGTLTLKKAWDLGVTYWMKIDDKEIRLRRKRFKYWEEFVKELNSLWEGCRKLEEAGFRKLSSLALKILILYYMGVAEDSIARLLEKGENLI